MLSLRQINRYYKIAAEISRAYKCEIKFTDDFDYKEYVISKIKPYFPKTSSDFKSYDLIIVDSIGDLLIILASGNNKIFPVVLMVNKGFVESSSMVAR